MPSVPRIDSLEQRRELLRVARANATRASGGADEVTSKIRVPGVFGGAFVTFWGKGKKLRGCVGSFGRTSDIVETIREVTTMSMTDSRFAADPISATELPELDIEVSILSDLELTDDPASLTPGVHGIVVRRGSRSGVLSFPKWPRSEVGRPSSFCRHVAP